MFLGEEDRYEHRALATEIVHRAQPVGAGNAFGYSVNIFDVESGRVVEGPGALKVAR